MRGRAKIALPQTKDDVVELKGGMDQVTPTLKLQPGVARRSLNFEAGINGGYTRIPGYERYDGRYSPSSTTFQLIPIPAFSNTPTVGQTLTGSTSGTTAIIVAVGANYLAVTNVLLSVFQEGEIVAVAGTVIGAIGPQTVALSKTLKKQYVNLAADVFRAFINEVPGKGPVRGVFGATFNGYFGVYAFRDVDEEPGNEGDGECYLYKATVGGWDLVHGFEHPLIDYTSEVNFSAGGPVPIPDNTPSSTIGGLSALRVRLTGGSWEAGTATGKMIYVSYDDILLQPDTSYTFGPTTITINPRYPAGGSEKVRFQAGGIFEFDFANFYGQEGQSRIYGVDGRNRAFEFDGEIIIPIDIGDPTVGDHALALHPTHVKVHHNHLILSVGSSVINSGVGTPHNMSAAAGGGEHAAGDLVTGFQILPGVQSSGALAVMQRNHTKVLYGTAQFGPEPFDLVSFQSDTGALPRTIQTLDRVYYLDDRGVIDLKTAQDYGNFTAATITRFIQKYIDQKHGRAACSMVQRTKGQYRLFFNDGTALFITLDNGKLRGSMPIAFPQPMFCAWSGEDSAGSEVSFLGGTNGMVYQMDRGTSFDGEAIDWELLLNWNSMKSPRQRKTLHRASFEIQDTDYAELRIGVRLGPEITAHLQDVESVVPSDNELTMQWDHFNYDEYWWDAHADAPLEVDVKGTAERVQYAIGGSSDYIDPFTLPSIITHYIPRRGIR